MCTDLALFVKRFSILLIYIMRIEIVIILLTSFFIYNTYHDNKYTKMFMAGKKILSNGILWHLRTWDLFIDET